MSWPSGDAPAAWSPGELAALGDGSLVSSTAREQILVAALMQEAAGVARGLSAEAEAAVSAGSAAVPRGLRVLTDILSDAEEDMLRSDFLWSYCMQGARAFGRHVPRICMAPLADFLNHECPPPGGDSDGEDEEEEEEEGGEDAAVPWNDSEAPPRDLASLAGTGPDTPPSSAAAFYTVAAPRDDGTYVRLNTLEARLRERTAATATAATGTASSSPWVFQLVSMRNYPTPAHKAKARVRARDRVRDRVRDRDRAGAVGVLTGCER